jgi:hypothetical protein
VLALREPRHHAASGKSSRYNKYEARIFMLVLCRPRFLACGVMVAEASAIPMVRQRATLIPFLLVTNNVQLWELQAVPTHPITATRAPVCLALACSRARSSSVVVSILSLP